MRIKRHKEGYTHPDNIHVTCDNRIGSNRIGTDPFYQLVFYYSAGAFILYNRSY